MQCSLSHHVLQFMLDAILTNVPVNKMLTSWNVLFRRNFFKASLMTALFTQNTVTLLLLVCYCFVYSVRTCRVSTQESGLA